MTDPRRRAWLGPMLEIIASLAAAGLFALVSTSIKVDPVDRVGQVSGLASLDLRFLLFAIPLVAALVIAARLRGGAAFARTSRIVCAIVAGLVSGMVAGGVIVALHGTHYGLAAGSGDTGVLSDWAEAVRRGGDSPSLYPPLQIHLIAWIADLFDTTALLAAKPWQILGVLVMGPAAYLSWRLVFPPIWALAIGVTAALPLVEPLRQYPFLSLVVFIPLAIKFLETLRRCDRRPAWHLVRGGVAIGCGFGLLCLNYSGWFMWSAPGFVGAALYLFPWRAAPRKGLLFCVVAGAMFALVTLHYMRSVMAAPPLHDDFMYFDATVDPGYIAMWRGAQPGTASLIWPPFGELGGVGLFTIVLAAGLGLATAFGRSRTLVVGVTSMMVGAWALRLWNAHLMWKTKLVQLYPRTTAEILYCLMILVGFAVYAAVERARSRASEDSVVRTPSGTIGAICGLLLLYGSAGSAISDRYMPKSTSTDSGYFAYVAQLTPEPDANQAAGAAIETSSSYEAQGWSSKHLVDGNPRTGYTSQFSGYYGHDTDHEEWIVLTFPTFRYFSRLELFPAPAGFPVDFTFEVWDSQKWIPRVMRAGLGQPDGPRSFSWLVPDWANRVRLRATKLAKVGDDHLLQLYELELFLR